MLCHVGLGTDFDGGFGWPAVPYEIDTIADLQKLAPLLAEYGYNEESIAGYPGWKLAPPSRKEPARTMSLAENSTSQYPDTCDRYTQRVQSVSGAGAPG